MRFDRAKFFSGVRERIDPTLEQPQVDGLETMLAGFESDPRWSDVRLIAYALATAFHETAGSFQPVEEGYYLGSKARVKKFQKSLRYYPYFGRGYVQLTWKKNYETAGKTLGLDLVNQPELALDAATAFRILTEGLFRGWFGGRLTTYINDTKTDYVNARKCVNLLDKAGLIAGYARSFEKILRASSSAAGSTDRTNGPASDEQAAGRGSAGGGPLSSSPEPPPMVPTPPEEPDQRIVSVPPVQTDVLASMTNRIQTWKAALPPFVVSVGAGIWSWLQGAAAEIVVAFFATAGVVAIAFLYFNFKSRENEKERVEKQKERDFELTKLQIQSAMDPNKQTIRIAPPPVEVPDTAAPAE